jgi:hypothetical protein
MSQSESGQPSQTRPLDHQSVEAQDSPWASSLSIWFLSSLIALFLIPFFALFFYSVPALDDFCKATLSFNAVPQKNAIAVTWLYYSQWSPRWITTFIQSFVMSHLDLGRSYGWLLLAVSLSNIAALWYFFKRVFSFSSGSAAQAAGVFYAAYVASLIDPTQQFFFVTVAIEYSLSLTTLLVLLGLLFRGGTSAWYYIAIAALSLVIPAQHEIAGTFLLAVLAGGLVILIIRKFHAPHWYVAFAAALLSQIVVMLSPGTRLRAAQEHRHMWDLTHLPRWVGHSFYHGIGWLSQPTILLAACCIVVLAQSNRFRSSAANRWPSRPGLIGIFAMIVVCCEIALVEIASGTWIPNRVVAWFQFVFWLLFICILLIGVPELDKVRLSASTRLGIFFLFVFALFSSENYRAAISDLRGPARAWRQLNDARLHEPGGARQFTVITPYPKLAMPQMLAPDSGCWVNQCMANYLHATSVVGKDSSVECLH